MKAVLFLVPLDDNPIVDTAANLLTLFGVSQEDIVFCPDGIPDEGDRELCTAQAVYVFPGVHTTPEEWPGAELIFLIHGAAAPRPPSPQHLLALAGFTPRA